jgi:hypothetical protein
MDFTTFRPIHLGAAGLVLVAIILGGVLLPAGHSRADIVSVSGDVVQGAPPEDSVAVGGSENDSNARAFREQAEKNLEHNVWVNILEPDSLGDCRTWRIPGEAGGGNIDVDTAPGGSGGYIPTGWNVGSHLIHADREGSSTASPFNHYNGTVTFDKHIMGVIVSEGALDQSDDDLKLSGTTYPNVAGQSNRGFENNLAGSEAEAGNRDWIQINCSSYRTVEFHLEVAEGIDQIRVITDENDPPVANNSAHTINEDNPLSSSVSSSDPDGDARDFVLVSGPTHAASFSFNTGNGTFAYTPAANYCGSDSFQFRATDVPAGKNSNVATVTINVTCVPDPPICDGASVTVNEDSTSGPFSLNCHDVDSPVLTCSVVVPAGKGSLNAGNCSPAFYTAGGPDKNGADSVGYRAYDGTSFSNDATLTVNILPVNDPPIPADDSATVYVNQPSAPTSVVVSPLGNDAKGPATATDEISQGLTIDSFSAGASTHGAVAIDPGSLTLTYTPDQGYTGPASFTYTARDNGTSGSPPVADPKTSLTSAIINIQVLALNQQPTGSDGTVTLDEDTSLLIDLGAFVEDDETTDATNFQYAIDGAPSHGSLSGSGRFVTYHPAQDYNNRIAPDSLVFHVTDQGYPLDCSPAGDYCAPPLDSGPVTVHLDVIHINDVPIAGDDSLAASQDLTSNYSAAGLLGDDVAARATATDELDLPEMLSVIAVDPTANTHGSASLASGTITYVPDAGFHGPADFEYTVCDDGTSHQPPVLDILCATGTVLVWVNAQPLADDASFTIWEDEPLSISLAALASDAETNDAGLTYTIDSAPQHGTVSGAGELKTYVPNFNYNSNNPAGAGPDSFTYHVTDRGYPENCGIETDVCAPPRDSEAGTISITVKPRNDPPQVNTDTFTVQTGQPLSIPFSQIIANDWQGIGNPPDERTQVLTVTGFKTWPNTHGTVTMAANSFTYTSTPGYTGDAMFYYEVCDNGTSGAPPVPDHKCSNGEIWITVQSAPGGALVYGYSVQLRGGQTVDGGMTVTFDCLVGPVEGKQTTGTLVAPPSAPPSGYQLAATNGQDFSVDIDTEQEACPFNSHATICMGFDSSYSGVSMKHHLNGSWNTVSGPSPVYPPGAGVAQACGSVDHFSTFALMFGPPVGGTVELITAQSANAGASPLTVALGSVLAGALAVAGGLAMKRRTIRRAGG